MKIKLVRKVKISVTLETKMSVPYWIMNDILIKCSKMLLLLQVQWILWN